MDGLFRHFILQKTGESYVNLPILIVYPLFVVLVIPNFFIAFLKNIRLCTNKV